MSFIEQDSRNESASREDAGIGDANYFAFFDKPTPENLAANHGGILAAQQQKALDGIIAAQKHSAVIFGSMSVAAVLFLCFLFWKIDALDGVISFDAQLINSVVVILIFGVFIGFIVGDWFLFFAGDDLTNGVVESATGKIEWNGKRYQMRTDTRLLRSSRLSRVTLPPAGDYRFYYLPRTGLVVMAEEVRTKKAHDPARGLLLALASANKFSLDDLSQNQKGLLSKRQENWLSGILLFYGLIFISGLVLIGSMILQILRAESTTYFIMLTVIAALLVLRFGVEIPRIVWDVWRGKVKQVEGPVSPRTRRSRYHTSYFYECGSHKFQVSASAYRALLEQPTYRIYYVPHSKRLVSIEPIHLAGQTH